MFFYFPPTEKTICIDPGHPSEVGMGTRGRKLTEVHINWIVAEALKEKLKADGYRVVLTKSTEVEKVLNKNRAKIANESSSSLLIRLHCDAASGSGFAVYYPSQEGKSGTMRGPSAEVVAQSARAAKLFHASLAVSLKGKHFDNGLKTDLATAVGAKQGALTGSIYSKVPTVLVEMVVLTNPKDEAFVASRSGFEALVEGLRQGVRAAVK